MPSRPHEPAGKRATGHSGSTRPAHRWLHRALADAPALLALATAALLLVPQVVLLGKLPDNPDYWLQEYVHLAVLHRWLRAGELPLWNGQLAAGTPHLADPQTAVLYPLTTLPLLVFEPALVARLSIPLHFFLAGALTYGYARSLKLSRLAATAAGLAYALAPHFAPLTNATYLQQSAAWVPAILWALHTGFERRRLAPFAVAGLLWALQLTRGYPQTWYVTGLLAAGYVVVRTVPLLFRLFSRPLESRSRSRSGAADEGQMTEDETASVLPGALGRSSFVPGRPDLTGALGIGLAALGAVAFAAVGLGAGAAQLLPSLELLAESHRSGGYSLAEASGYGAVTLATLLGAAGPEAEVSGAFVGGTTLGLALAALLYARGTQVWLHVGLAAVGLALCLGHRTPLWALAYGTVPGFTTLHMPHRMLFLWSLPLAVLAGFGVDALRNRPPLRPLLITSAALAGLAWLSLPTIPNPASATSTGTLQLTAGLAAIAATALAAGLGWRQAPRPLPAPNVPDPTSAPMARLPFRGPLGHGDGPGMRSATVSLWLARAPLLLPALVAADLLAHNLPRLYGQFYPPNQVYAPPPAVAWLQARLDAHLRAAEGPFRFASAEYRLEAPVGAPAGQAGREGPEDGQAVQDNRRLTYLPPNVSALYPGLDAAQGYLAIRLAASGQLFDAVNDLGVQPRILSIHDPRSRLLDLLNVRYFVANAAETFPSVAGGGRSLVATDPPFAASIREPLPARSLELLSSLGDAVDVEDGTVVATIALRTREGRELSLPIRAGEHTAEWLYDAPGVAGTVRHRKAPIAQSNDQGGGRRSHVYRATFGLAALGPSDAVQEIRLQALHPRARWNVAQLVLHIPFAGRFRLAHAEGPLRIWENPAALPRAWWVGGYAVEPDRGVALELLRDPTFDFSRQAILDRPVPDLPPAPLFMQTGPAGLAAPAAPTTQDGAGDSNRAGSVAMGRITANTRELETTAPTAGLLVLSETYAPGWQAWIDGRAVPIYPANGNLQAVPVPAGNHQVRLGYQPRSVVLGAAISATTVAALALLSIRGLLSRRARVPAPKPDGTAST